MIFFHKIPEFLNLWKCSCMFLHKTTCCFTCVTETFSKKGHVISSPKKTTCHFAYMTTTFNQSKQYGVFFQTLKMTCHLASSSTSNWVVFDLVHNSIFSNLLDTKINVSNHINVKSNYLMISNLIFHQKFQKKNFRIQKLKFSILDIIKAQAILWL